MYPSSLDMTCKGTKNYCKMQVLPLSMQEREKQRLKRLGEERVKVIVDMLCLLLHLNMQEE